jgi:hypothetical protein
MPRKNKPGAGRPRRITSAVVAKVAESMSYGVPEEYACLLHGVNPASYGPAVSRNETLKTIAKTQHAKFMLRLGKACANGGEFEPVLDKDGAPVFDDRNVQVMRHIPWQGMMTLAERRYKPHYNKTDTHALTTTEGSGLLTEADMLELEKIVKDKVLK